MVKIAVAQFNSQDDIEINFNNVETLLKNARANDAELLVLPENFACFAAGKQLETAQRFDEFKSRLEKLAFDYQIWLIAGTLPCPYRPNGEIVPDGRVRTVSLCISPEGKTVARYDKIHLFDVKVADDVGSYRESSTYEAGNEVICVETPFAKIGMMICYDIRFPELALQLRADGANLLTAPSAFTYTTGQMHWQTLLQARAIDTQSMVLGAAQQGWHCDHQRQTWGHSMIVNCQSNILAQSHDEGLQLIIADFDLDYQNFVRDAMPLMQHRKLILF